MAHFDVVIVGAGHAGGQCAIALRQHGFVGSVAIIGDEPDPPYERPPLSKEFLSGEKEFERLLLRPRAFWSERNITLHLGQRVEALSALNHVVMLADGERVSYGQLVWAAGGAPRRLNCTGHHLSGLHYVRNRGDVESLKAELTAATNAVVIGGGYIGLEAAAVMRKLGKTVTVLEFQDRVLARVAGEALSRFIEAEHRARGVNIQLGACVTAIEERAGRVAGVRLDDGSVVAAEIAIVGIGIVPNVAPLVAAGASGSDGVDVDAYCYTTLQDVFAIGDCARHVNRFAHSAAPIRLESVQNAADQADAVAKTISGKPAAYGATPWFWSNQYDLKLQTVGLSRGHTDVVTRGNPDNRSFSLVYLRDGKVVALDCVNSVKDYMQGRALVERQAICAPSDLANTELTLKSLAAPH